MFHLRCAVPRRWSLALIVAVTLLGLAGCGGPRLYPVRGKVVWENGAAARELAGGTVVCESEDGKVAARGEIGDDGSFELSTHKPGDGALLGKHRVAIAEYSPKEPTPPPISDRAFSNVQTSGLQINVEQKTNEVTLKVRRASSRQRR
jgi:hypothetical protein